MEDAVVQDLHLRMATVRGWDSAAEVSAMNKGTTLVAWVAWLVALDDLNVQISDQKSSVLRSVEVSQSVVTGHIMDQKVSITNQCKYLKTLHFSFSWGQHLLAETQQSEACQWTALCESRNLVWVKTVLRPRFKELQLTFILFWNTKCYQSHYTVYI